MKKIGNCRFAKQHIQIAIRQKAFTSVYKRTNLFWIKLFFSTVYRSKYALLGAVSGNVMKSGNAPNGDCRFFCDSLPGSRRRVIDNGDFSEGIFKLFGNLFQPLNHASGIYNLAALLALLARDVFNYNNTFADLYNVRCRCIFHTAFTKETSHIIRPPFLFSYLLPIEPPIK